MTGRSVKAPIAVAVLLFLLFLLGWGRKEEIRPAENNGKGLLWYETHRSADGQCSMLAITGNHTYAFNFENHTLTAVFIYGGKERQEKQFFLPETARAWDMYVDTDGNIIVVCGDGGFCRIEGLETKEGGKVYIRGVDGK